MFILVGDSSEKDPEVYGTVARSHPAGQVLRIFIHRVKAGGRDDPERFRIAFEGGFLI